MKQELLTAQTFAILLESTMREKKLSHIDAILEICKSRSLDVETVPSLIDAKVRKRILNEGLSLHMIKSPRTRKVI